MSSAIKNVTCPVCGLSAYASEGKIWSHQGKAAPGIPGIATMPRRGARECPGSGLAASKARVDREIRIGSRVELPKRSSYRDDGDTHGDVVKIKKDAAWVRMDSDRMDWFPIADLKIAS